MERCTCDPQVTEQAFARLDMCRSGLDARSGQRDFTPLVVAVHDDEIFGFLIEGHGATRERHNPRKELRPGHLSRSTQHVHPIRHRVEACCSERESPILDEAVDAFRGVTQSRTS